MRTKIFFTFLIFFCSKILGQESYLAPKITDSFGNENPVIDCNYPLNGKCLTLNVTAPSINRTASYIVSSENFTPYVAFNSGTPINADADDLFLEKIVLPFNFCFFENTFKEVIIGSNGLITFDSSQLGNDSPPNIQALIPNKELIKNAIFGVFQDLKFSKDEDSEIYYSTIGVAPYRKFIINFYEARSSIVGCDQTFTSQIVLSEGSNEIEIFVDKKPLPCNTGKHLNSLIGIQNSDGTLGYSPPGRNTGVWAAFKEAYKFKPSDLIITPAINWFNSENQYIGEGNSVSVCPEKNENYTVKVNYLVCGNNTLVLEKTSAVTFDPSFPLAKDFTQVFCGNSSFNVNLDNYRADLTHQKDPGRLNFTFHNSLEEAEAGLNALTSEQKTFALTGNKIYYVRVQNKADSECFRTAVLNLTLISNSLITNTIEICDVNNDGVEKDYILSRFNLKLFNSPSGTIHYFLSKSDADANINEVQNANIINGTELFVNYKTTNCSQLFGPIKVTFLPSPVVNTPVNYVIETCDFRNDSFEPFKNIEEHIEEIKRRISLDQSLEIKFYDTYAQAYEGIGSGLQNIKKGKYTIYARVEVPGACFSIAEVNLDVTFAKVDAVDKNVYICFDGTEDIEVNLDEYSSEMLLEPVDSSNPIKISYFASVEDAETEVKEVPNPLELPNIQKITTDGNLVTKTFIVKFTNANGCYALKELSINLVHVIIARSQFTVCDLNNDGVENVSLSQFEKDIIYTQNAKTFFYETLEDANNKANPILNTLVSNTKKLYVRIESYGCFNIFEININLIPAPIIKTKVVKVRFDVCDNNNDGEEVFNLTDFEPEIYTGNDAVFTYFTNYNPADSSLSGKIDNFDKYPVKDSIRVFAKVNVGSCYSVSEINLKNNYLPAIILKDGLLQKCDFKATGGVLFYRDESISQVFVQNDNSVQFKDLVFEFYKSKEDANEGISGKQINFPYTAISSDDTIWVRSKDIITGCYSVAAIKLESYLPPKPNEFTIINDICDDNLDGLYDVNLLSYTGNMINFNPDNKFSFYKSQKDAQEAKNSIPNPENYSANPLGTVWVRVENIRDCAGIGRIEFNLGNIVELDNPGSFAVTNVCDIDNDGIEAVDLTQFENQIYSGNAIFEYFPTLLDLSNNENKIVNPQSYLFNENLGTNKIFVKISADNFCPEKAEINLNLKKTPIFNLPDYYFCSNGSVDIQPDFSALDIIEYEWKNPSGEVVSVNNELLEVGEDGVYTLKVTAENGCTFSSPVNVIKYEVPIIMKIIADGNVMTVIATGSRAILYSTDGINFQTSNVFKNLPVGVITFYVKFFDSDCLGETKQGLILDIANTITPNGDNVNDTWDVDNLQVFEGKKASLKIFDRFQKLIFEQESATRLEWDGKSLGRQIPTTSYWYVLTLPDGRLFSGWILLKNRN